MFKQNRQINFGIENSGAAKEVLTKPIIEQQVEKLPVDGQKAEALSGKLDAVVEKKYEIGTVVDNPSWENSDTSEPSIEQKGRFKVLDPNEFINNDIFVTNAEQSDVFSVNVGGVEHVVFARKGQMKYVMQKVG